MLEILFRGKCIVNGEWVEGYLTKRPSSIQIGYCSPWYIYVPPRDPDDSGCTYNVIPETIGQYTDLEDKNGVKIFNGDILKVKTMWHAEFPEDENGVFSAPIKKETYWSVEYKNFAGEMGFMVYGIDRRWHTKLTWNKLYNSEAVVVGNIYDNPELLKD